MQLPDFTDPLVFILTTIAAFAVIMGRYVLIAGIFYTIFYLWYPLYWKQRKIAEKEYKPQQLKNEIKWSAITALIFALTTTVVMVMWQLGLTKVYFDINEYSTWWLPASLVISMLLHETYYYWLHRWMHRPSVFRLVHKVHHDSNTTSPWTAFSFHPIEGLLQAIYLPALLMIMPMHLYVIIIQLTLMTFSSVINHLNIEIYPRNFHNHSIGKWLIGATHHSLHHKQFKYNYGLYFTIWDKLKETESPVYEKLFEEKTKAAELSAAFNVASEKNEIKELT